MPLTREHTGMLRAPEMERGGSGAERKRERQRNWNQAEVKQDRCKANLLLCRLIDMDCVVLGS